jgi:hypothetical protein
VYGTQVEPGPDGDVVPRTPIEDAADVDARRSAAGLGTLEAYYDEMRRLMAPPASSAPSAPSPSP